MSVPLIHVPSPLQRGVSSPGAGTNTECVDTVQQPTSFSLISYLVSDLFSLAVELDTLWQCVLQQLPQDKTPTTLHQEHVLYVAHSRWKLEEQNDSVNLVSDWCKAV